MIKAVQWSKKYRWLLLAAGVLLPAWISLLWGALPQGLTSPPWAYAVFSAEGKLLDVRIAADEQWRFPSPEKLPEKYVQAVLAFEDRHFYRHFGINPFSVMRAARDNWQSGRVVSGASTITMQVARMALEHSRRSYTNKLKEIWLALQLETRLEKNAILGLYASHAPLGGNVIGLQAASWYYFGRAPDELSWAEAALLAVLPNRPSMLHLRKNRLALQQKRDQLLAYLHSEGRFDDNDYRLAKLEPLPMPLASWPAKVPHLLDRLIKENPGQSLFYTSINARLQGDMARLVENHSRELAEEGVRNIALVVINHQTLKSVVYIGNYTIDAKSLDVDIANSPRSSGSVLKPLLYASMLQDGDIIPTMLVSDIPTTFGNFSPKNNDAEYRGAVPASQMVAQSLNVPAVRMLKQYGVERFRHQLQKFGFTTITRSADNYGLSLILGGAETTLWELASVYARLSHIADGSNLSGKAGAVTILQQTDNAIMPVLPFPVQAGSAWLTLQTMTDVVRPGADTFWRYYENNQMIAWKTGTSYGLRDAWAVGSNGQYTVGIWTGNADGSASASLGGAHSAGPILMEAFTLLGVSPWLQEPLHDIKTVQVCADDGYLANASCQAVDARIPAGSSFERITPYHQRLFLSLDGQHRVHPGCATPSSLQTQDWFILPPTQEFFWKQQHSEYRTIPPWRKDCIASLQQYTGELPFALIYPDSENSLYLPLDMQGKLGKAVFRAVHRNPDAVLYWHVDGEYLGETRLYHEKNLQAKPGKHKLVLVDQDGQRLERSFSIYDAGQEP